MLCCIILTHLLIGPLISKKHIHLVCFKLTLLSYKGRQFQIVTQLIYHRLGLFEMVIPAQPSHLSLSTFCGLLPTSLFLCFWMRRSTSTEWFVGQFISLSNGKLIISFTFFGWFSILTNCVWSWLCFFCAMLLMNCCSGGYLFAQGCGTFDRD